MPIKQTLSCLRVYCENSSACGYISLSYLITTLCHVMLYKFHFWSRLGYDFKLLFLRLATGKDSGKTSGRIVESDMNDIGRFLNRLLGLPPDIQNRYVIYDLISYGMWILESGYINWCWVVDINVQDFWVICQHIGSSNSESTHWRESRFWNCWYESQCYWITRKSQGLLFFSYHLSVFCCQPNEFLLSCRLFMLIPSLGPQLCCLHSLWIVVWPGRFVLKFYN